MSKRLGQLKDHVCDEPGCWKSFDTERGLEHHKRRGNHG